jgi:hypothetical protein
MMPTLVDAPAAIVQMSANRPHGGIGCVPVGVTTDSKGVVWGEGQTLGDCLALAENGLVPVGDPYGEAHMISLAPFAGQDPNHFLLFKFIELREDRENFDHIHHGNGVVLKDYELPPGTEALA